MTNVIVIHGRLTRDPKLRVTPAGKEVCNFTVAVDRNYVPQGQERQTDFFDCTLWGARAQVVSKYFTKGSEIVVTGSMESREYTDKNGSKRKSWDIQVQNFDFCGSKQGGSNITPKNDDFTPIDESEDLPWH